MKQIIGYPRVSKRIQALLIDSIIVAVGAIGTLIVVSKLGAPGAYSAIMAGLVVCDTPVTPLDTPKTWSKPSRVDSSARIA